MPSSNNGTRPRDLSPGSEPRRKRCRITFSCTNCRHSKQRCNRQKPCMTCLIRGKQNTCHYEEAIFDLNNTSLPSVVSHHAGDRSTQTLYSELASSQDLTRFGYSNVNDHNSLGIVKKLEHYETGTNHISRKTQKQGVSLSPATREKYSLILRMLPCRSCTNILVNVFFSEVNWIYSLLDISYFDDQLHDFYERSSRRISDDQDSLTSEAFIFPCLLFQVIALALQFLPLDHDGSLDHHGCTGNPSDHTGKGFSDAGLQLSALFERDTTNFTSVQALFLRVSWLKNSGRVAEAWQGLAQVAVDAQEIGLHREGGRVDATDAEGACSELWSIVIRRRLMVNLFLWDSQMGMVLGKSMNITLGDCSIVPPTDTQIPRNRKSTVPTARTEFEKPTSFTQRLMEFRLHVNLPKVRALEAEGPYPRDWSKVERLHREALDYIETLPPIYRFENPDRSFDGECPWLVPQREYFCSVTWFFILVLHRPYIFSMPRSRTEIMRAGMAILYAQQRNFECLKPHHYKVFTLAFLTVEASVSMLAVLIAYSNENTELFSEAMQCIRQGLERLDIIRDTNGLAGPGADVIQTLLLRAETVKITPGLEQSNSPATNKSSPRSVEANAQIASARSFTSQNRSSNITWDPPHFDGSQYSVPPTIPSISPEYLSYSPMESTSEIDYGYLAKPLQPTADLMYCDLAPAQGIQENAAQNFAPTIRSTADENSHMMVGSELEQQFVGAFGEHTFWNFVNEGL